MIKLYKILVNLILIINPGNCSLLKKNYKIYNIRD